MYMYIHRHTHYIYTILFGVYQIFIKFIENAAIIIYNFSAYIDVIKCPISFEMRYYPLYCFYFTYSIVTQDNIFFRHLKHFCSHYVVIIITVPIKIYTKVKSLRKCSSLKPGELCLASLSFPITCGVQAPVHPASRSRLLFTPAILIQTRGQPSPRIPDQLSVSLIDNQAHLNLNLLSWDFYTLRT